MKHLVALLIKLTFTEAIAWLFLVASGATVGQALVIGAITTAILYLMGDMMVLPTAGNITASIGDGGLAAFTAWLSRYYVGSDIGLSTALLYALSIGIAEYFFHQYLQRAILPDGPIDI